MNNLNTLIYSGYILSGVVIVIFLMFSFISMAERIREYKLLKKDYEMERDRLDRQTNLDKSIFEILDKIIDDSFNEHIVLNYGYMKNFVANAEEEEKICRDVCGIVAVRISPTLRAKACLIYNEESFDSLIAQKIYIRTMAYALETKKVKNKGR